MNNKGVLTIIAVILLALLGIVGMQYYEDQKSPGQKISEGISEGIEEIGDEIDDATTAR